MYVCTFTCTPGTHKHKVIKGHVISKSKKCLRYILEWIQSVHTSLPGTYIFMCTRIMYTATTLHLNSTTTTTTATVTFHRYRFLFSFHLGAPLPFNVRNINSCTFHNTTVWGPSLKNVGASPLNMPRTCPILSENRFHYVTCRPKIKENA